MPAEESEEIASHDLADFGGLEPDLEQCLGDLDEAGGVEGGAVAVEVRTQANRLDPGHLDGVTDGARNGGRIGSANRPRPVADPDQAAPSPDRFQMLISEVAPPVAGPLDSAV